MGSHGRTGTVSLGVKARTREVGRPQGLKVAGTTEVRWSTA